MPRAPVRSESNFENPEVEDLQKGRSVARGHDEVLGLQIPVNDAGQMRGVDTLARLVHEVGQLADVNRPGALQPLVEGLAVDQLHEQVRLARVELARVERLGDMRVRDARRRGRLANEALHDARLPGGPRVEDLERAVVLGQLVLDLVDRAHSPHADNPDDPEAAGNQGAGRIGRVLGGRRHER